MTSGCIIPASGPFLKQRCAAVVDTCTVGIWRQADGGEHRAARITEMPALSDNMTLNAAVVAGPASESLMPLKKLIGLSFIAICCSGQVAAADRMTADHIRAVMAAADRASVKQDVQAIGACLATDFFKYIDIPSDKRPATARINKDQYLGLIRRGWQQICDYTYERRDIVVNVSPDGQTGESFSTVIEHFTADGKHMMSKVREDAQYKLEDGKPVISTVQNQTLVGDTTPE